MQENPSRFLSGLHKVFCVARENIPNEKIKGRFHIMKSQHKRMSISIGEMTWMINVEPCIVEDFFPARWEALKALAQANLMVCYYLQQRDVYYA